ncbi:unnamed protein product [Thlaspi arvense]|uniref:Uncharacterized protein n=1 Tax=Thlaspi arvense TaxID=13288 RepID=A0AAU9S2G3_THLAR|nr:unnamed protein product [Thlaspi arvense]
MARYIGPLVCLLVMAMDITAGILGIEAEVAQNKVKNLRAWIFECRDPSYEAFKLGMAAVVLLSLAHTIANLLGGCICFWSREELERASPNKQLADYVGNCLLPADHWNAGKLQVKEVLWHSSPSFSSP